MRDSDVDLYTFERLRDEFGPFAAVPKQRSFGPRPSGS